MSLKDMLKRHEGLRLKPYVDTVGKTTIGYGRNLTDNGISEIEADMMLETDIGRALSQCRSVFPWFDALDSVRQDVLVDMAFNMGIKALQGFSRTLRYIEDGEYREAAKEMMSSHWAVEVGVRASELSVMMATGTYGDSNG